MKTLDFYLVGDEEVACLVEADASRSLEEDLLLSLRRGGESHVVWPFRQLVKNNFN